MQIVSSGGKSLKKYENVNELLLRLLSETRYFRVLLLTETQSLTINAIHSNSNVFNLQSNGAEYRVPFQAGGARSRNRTRAGHQRAPTTPRPRGDAR